MHRMFMAFLKFPFPALCLKIVARSCDYTCLEIAEYLKITVKYSKLIHSCENELSSLVLNKTIILIHKNLVIFEITILNINI